MCNNGLNEKNSEEHHWKWVINTDGIERWHQEPRIAKVPQSFPTQSLLYPASGRITAYRLR